MTFDEYAAIPALNATAIKAGRLSMAHMRQAITQKPPTDESPAMRWGRLQHLAVLEPVELARLAVWTGGDKRTEAKAWRAFKEMHEGADIITEDELDSLSAISAAFTLSGAAQLVAGARHEVTLTWEGVAGSVSIGPCKARLDSVHKDGFVEYKSTRAIATRAFMSQCEQLGYPLQLGWYALGLAATGTPAQTVYVVAQENKAPWCVAIYEVPANVLRTGGEEACEIARQYRVHELCGSFPGPYDGQRLLYERPEWATGEAELNMEGVEEL
jgi:hypothetical protein